MSALAEEYGTSIRTGRNPRRYRPVVILGAARSGTNLLRDALAEHSSVATWDCDEINAIWRHGNTRRSTDEFGGELARPAVASFIRGEFDRLARHSGASIVLEKTCANTLRVPFIEQVLPNARYLHIVRDGRDAAASALERWRAPFELAYTLKKLRYVPKMDLLSLGVPAVGARLKRFWSSDRRVGTWGPRFPGMETVLKERPLLEVCALQWRACVDAADGALAAIPRSRVYALRYEDFVSNPRAEFERILEFLDLSREDSVVLGSVTTSSIGRWRKVLSAADAAAITELEAETLLRHGYAL